VVPEQAMAALGICENGYGGQDFYQVTISSLSKIKYYNYHHFH
jgi:hypothetical protein